MLKSPAVFKGSVFHKRFKPFGHHFTLPFGCYFLHLSGNEKDINASLKSHGLSGCYKRRNYFGDPQERLKTSVLKKISTLLNKDVQGDVYFLGQLQHMRFYFSSVNFYFVRAQEHFEYMLAEVTNTPWGETHCYALPLDQKNIHDKEFHVSPFNPMDMTYDWTIKTEDDKFYLKIDCKRDSLEFTASIHVNRSLTKANYTLMPIRMLLGIYWHALILFIKKNPVYPHP